MSLPQSVEPKHVVGRKIAVSVSFPIGGKKPYRESLSATTTVSELLRLSKAHFGVADTEAERYYISHDQHQAPETQTIGDLAGRAKKLECVLAKELIQG